MEEGMRGRHKRVEKVRGLSYEGEGERADVRG